MAIVLTEDIKSASELKKHMREIFQQTHKTKRPVVITVNGKPDVVVLDIEVFEENLKTRKISQLLAAAEDDIRHGRTRPARAFLKTFKNARKISR